MGGWAKRKENLFLLNKAQCSTLLWVARPDLNAHPKRRGKERTQTPIHSSGLGYLNRAVGLRSIWSIANGTLTSGGTDY